MVRPKNGLDPYSQPWARSIEDDVVALQQLISKIGVDNANALKSLNGTLSTLGGEIQDIRLLLERQSVSVGQEAGLVGTSMIAGWQNTASDSIAVPDWATTATVISIGTINALDTTSGGLAYLDVRMAIAGSTSSEITLPVTVGVSTAQSSGSLPKVNVLTVVPGSSISVALQVRPSNPAAYTSWTAYVSSIVTFTL